MAESRHVMIKHQIKEVAIMILKYKHELIKDEVVSIDISVEHKEGNLFVPDKDVLVYHVSLKNGEKYKLTNSAAAVEVGDIVEIASFDEDGNSLLNKKSAKSIILAKNVIYASALLTFIPIGILFHESIPVFQEVGLTLGMAGFYCGVAGLAAACFKSVKNVKYFGFSEDDYKRIKAKAKHDTGKETDFSLGMSEIKLKDKLER